MTRARALPIQILSPLLTRSAAHAQTGQSVIKKLFGLECSPQRRTHRVTRFFVIFFLLSTPCFGQSWSNVLSSSRAINWTGAGLPATLPDGETTPNPWTPPTRTQCVTSACNAVSGGAVTATSVNAALASAPHGTYVLMPPGNFTISSATISMYSQSGVTLRGSGAQSTTLTLTGSANVPVLMGSTSGSNCSWTAGYSAGTTSITLSGCGSAPSAGNIILLQQCDSGFSVYNPSTGGCTTGSHVDNGGIYVCALDPVCQRSGEGTGNYTNQTQVVYVSSVSSLGGGSYTVKFSPGLYLPNWSSINTPVAVWSSATYGNGLEDMTIYATGLTGANAAVYLNETYGSWIKGVRFLGSGLYETLTLNNAKNCLVMNNYFFPDIAIDAKYPPPMQEGTDSDDLVINNMMTSGVPWEGTGAMEGDVIAFNYTTDNFTSYVLDIFGHNAGNALLLFEGNQTPSIQEDDTHGTHDLSTLFRNYILGWEAPYVSTNFAGVSFDSFDRFTNSVGNAIGSAQLTSYQSTWSNHASSFVYSYDSTDSAHSDPLTFSSSLRWGNYDTVTGAARWCGNSASPGWSATCDSTSEIPTTLTGNAAPFNNIVPSTTNLPCSFFLAGYTSTTCTAHPSGGTGLSFWKVCTSWAAFPTSCASAQTPPFPAAGPDVTGGPNINGYAYDIPAAVAFQKLPIDPAFQHAYSITSSSWSSGTETLTVIGLPNITHLMGPFQISGGACSTGTAEAYMTSSSAVTISYALASDPGGCTGGTFKFPDVRQFDERVYMADGGGVGDPPPPTPPTNVTATVE
jgi:hypothetical protein